MTTKPAAQRGRKPVAIKPEEPVPVEEPADIVVDTEKIAPEEDQQTPDQENEQMPDPETGLASDGENIGERAHGHTAETIDDMAKPSSVEERPAPMEGFIRVKGTGAHNRVSFMEVSRLHPTGDIFIVGDAEADVWPTQAVAEAIRSGRIVEV